MTDESLGSRGATLLKTDVRGASRTAVLPPTYPIGTHADGSIADAVRHLQAARVELRAGNLDAAIGKVRLVSGRYARLGDRQVAGLLRRAVWIAPFGQIDSATDLILQAETALRTY